MKLKVTPGKYVAAISGGVDSVVLLDLLNRYLKDAKQNLVVAHYDHGIRPDSVGDREFVQQIAKDYGLEFYYEDGKLGPNSSEALARRKRYEFLNRIKDKTDADAIVTAHHADDILETMVINVLRGTGRKGLSSLASRPGLARPLLKFSKTDIIGYAHAHGLAWREDETNEDQTYLRNYVRHNVLKHLTEAQKKALLRIYGEAQSRNKEIDGLINDLFFRQDKMPRSLFNSLEHNLAREVVAGWLRKEKISFDKETLDRLVVKLKTVRENKIIQASRGRYFTVSSKLIRMNTTRSV
ncbi:MAG TPA: tRNA lysidine(34) synthetase TilS [Candidatus Saccharimonadales bacterium]|nr:tRNA lysidine(34) synthetase TilS [Candidatus Saccharimonadales bacterium]